MAKKNDMKEMKKYEIAKELGLLPKVKKYGWKNLSAKETGKIGGLISKINKNKKEKA